MNKIIMIALFFFLGACATIEEFHRVDVYLGRTIALVTPANTTPNYRWPISVSYDENGREWVPKTCDEAVTEVKIMVPNEFLWAVGEVIKERSLESMLKNGNIFNAWEEVNSALDKRFPGEQGFLDSIESKIERAWVRGKSPGRKGFVRSCRLRFGPNVDLMWHALILSAATSEKVKSGRD